MRLTIFCVAFLGGFAALTADVMAQTKRDIHGLKTGMTRQQVASARKECGTTSECKVEGGSLTVSFQKHARPALSTRVLFQFNSGSEPDVMIQNVAKQFGSTFTVPKRFEIQTMWISKFLHPTVIAKWSLGGPELQLYYQKQEPNAYVLVLTDPALVMADKDAAQKKIEAEKAKKSATNPNPKF